MNNEFKKLQIEQQRLILNVNRLLKINKELKDRYMNQSEKFLMALNIVLRMIDCYPQFLLEVVTEEELRTLTKHEST